MLSHVRYFLQLACKRSEEHRYFCVDQLYKTAFILFPNLLLFMLSFLPKSLQWYELLLDYSTLASELAFKFLNQSLIQVGHTNWWWSCTLVHDRKSFYTHSWVRISYLSGIQ
jgi:hypothetical protein